MLINEIKNIKQNPAEWKKFGITVGIVLGLLGGFTAWRGHGIYPYFLGVSIFLIFFGLVLPKVLLPVYKIWMTLAVSMGWVMSHVLLTVLFYLLVTPIGLIARLTGKKFLDITFGEKNESYWIVRPKISKTQVDYEKQY